MCTYTSSCWCKYYQGSTTHVCAIVTYIPKIQDAVSLLGHAFWIAQPPVTITDPWDNQYKENSLGVADISSVVEYLPSTQKPKTWSEVSKTDRKRPKVRQSEKEKVVWAHNFGSSSPCSVAWFPLRLWWTTWKAKILLWNNTMREKESRSENSGRGCHDPLKDHTLETLRCLPVEGLLKEEPPRSLWKTVKTQNPSIFHRQSLSGD